MLQVAYPQTASGLLVISGTGCIALSKDASGTVRKLGGWGRMLGDEGGGYWLGLEALKHYAKATDRLVSQGPLFEAIRSEIVRLAGEHFADFRSALYSGTVSPAHFAKIVFDQSHDPAAEAIISRGVGALAELVRALLSRADRKIDSVVTLHGSVATDPLFVELFRSECGGGTEIRTISSVDAVVAALGEAERS
jgi:N-acetylglucosamine kinase-like BadF-type ATPase